MADIAYNPSSKSLEHFLSCYKEEDEFISSTGVPRYLFSDIYNTYCGEKMIRKP